MGGLAYSYYTDDERKLVQIGGKFSPPGLDRRWLLILFGCWLNSSFNDYIRHGDGGKLELSRTQVTDCPIGANMFVTSAEAEGTSGILNSSCQSLNNVVVKGLNSNLPQVPVKYPLLCD